MVGPPKRNFVSVEDMASFCSVATKPARHRFNNLCPWVGMRAQRIKRGLQPITTVSKSQWRCGALRWIDNIGSSCFQVGWQFVHGSLRFISYGFDLTVPVDPVIVPLRWLGVFVKMQSV